MNYLGHLTLTYPDAELTMGNLLGDMLRAKEVRLLPARLQKGVDIHHFIDAFTDRDPGIRGLTAFVRPVHGKYAPVVVDILLDHVLALQWDTLMPLPYSHFTEWVYSEMVPGQVKQIAHPVSKRIENMAAHRWLDGYPSRAGMQYVLSRMDRRTSFPSRFTEAMGDFDRHSEEFHSIFSAFYKRLREEYIARYGEVR